MTQYIARGDVLSKLLRSVSVSLSCDELLDIYMALSVMIEVFGKCDLVEIRNKIAEILSKCQGDNNPF